MTFEWRADSGLIRIPTPPMKRETLHQPDRVSANQGLPQLRYERASASGRRTAAEYCTYPDKAAWRHATHESVNENPGLTPGFLRSTFGALQSTTANTSSSVMMRYS